jgi:Tetratricopeptide repeat
LPTSATSKPAQNPNTQISAHLNLGHLARSRRDFPQAAQHYNQALALAPFNHPRHAEIQVAFTYFHLEQKQFPEARQSLQAAESADSDPPNPEIPNVRGILLLAEDTASPMRVPGRHPFAEKITESIAAFEQAEAMGHKTAASNRGNALLRLGRCEEALAAQQAAVARNPHHPGIRYNLALTQLRLGDFAHGWRNYEIRWSFREVHPSPRRFHRPRWQGEPLPRNSTLLIYAEQGLGDTLEFVRYLPLVMERLACPKENQGAPSLDCRGPQRQVFVVGVVEMWDQQHHTPNGQASIILEVQPPLTRLLTSHFANSTPTVQVIVHGDPLPHFTHHCPLMSLPAVFQTTPETVPNQLPYLHANLELTKTRASELSLSHPAIGIAWAGNPNYRADHERSTHLETFLPFLKIPNIHWVSLQKGEAARQIAQLPPHISLYDGCSRDQDFADTAALVANLDLVLTTDTAVAHLAGALGKPLWLLLPWQSDWRWMQDIPTTPWYPTARIFRQSTLNNWPELIHRVTGELRAFLKTRETAPDSASHIAAELPL